MTPESQSANEILGLCLWALADCTDSEDLYAEAVQAYRVTHKKHKDVKYLVEIANIFRDQKKYAEERKILQEIQLKQPRNRHIKQLMDRCQENCQ